MAAGAQLGDLQPARPQQGGLVGLLTLAKQGLASPEPAVVRPRRDLETLVRGQTPEERGLPDKHEPEIEIGSPLRQVSHTPSTSARGGGRRVDGLTSLEVVATLVHPRPACQGE
jgi:hypothetical protein